MGDRSGSREPKGASLKKSKKNPGASVTKMKKLSMKALGIQQGPVSSLPAPSLINEFEGSIFDCGVALLSRQFDRDRERVIQRAISEGKCAGMLIWFSDIEKQASIADFCKMNSGVCYYATGIHPDNIDRTNKKSHDEWLERIEELGRKPECLAIMTGLNLSREMGTHFSQESLLKASLAVAEKLILPTIFHVPDMKSLERLFELLEAEFLSPAEESSGNEAPFIIHDIITSSAGDERLLSHPVLQHPRVFCSLSGAGITDPDEAIATRAKQFVRALAQDRLLVCSDSPWRTPQNLADTYLRTLRNEPANLPAVLQAVHEALQLPAPSTFSSPSPSTLEGTTSLLWSNSIRVLNLERLSAAAIASHKMAAVAEEGDDNDEDDEEEENEADEEEVKKAAVVEKVGKKKGGKGNKDREDHETKLAETALEQLNLKPSTASTSDTAGITSPVPNSNNKKDALYRCVKCRQLLFKSKDITTHTLSAAKTVFKVGEEGLCSSFHFVGAAEGRDLHKRLGLSIRGGNVECSECGVKLGKYSAGEAVCPCGAVVQGPVTKINAQKVDFHAEDEAQLDAEQLAARSRVEVAEMRSQVEFAEAQEEELRQAQAAAGRGKKAKKHKSENKGNFSSFRNKSFIPNASKTANVNAVAGGGKKGGTIEERQGSDEEDDEDSERED